MSATTANSPLGRLVTELDANEESLRSLVRGLTPERLGRRAVPSRWSIAEHVEHLNLTTASYLPIIEAAADELHQRGLRSNGPYRTDLMGRFLLWMSEPPVRKRVRTTAQFVPGPEVDPARVVERFESLQRDLRTRVLALEGLALDRARIRSPFDPRIRYSAWSALRILPAHQRRHLWLAQRVRASIAREIPAEPAREINSRPSREGEQTWAVGDVFALPLSDGSAIVGQIVGREASALNSVTIALFDVKCAADEVMARSRDLQLAQAFAILFVTRDLFDAGTWKVVGSRAVVVPRAMQPYEHTRASGWVGAKITGSGIVNEFADAFYGLAPWDDWAQRDYLDGLLVDPSRKPHARLVYKHR